MFHDPALLGRRRALPLLIAALGSTVLLRHAAVARSANDTAAITPLQHLNAALLAAMKAGRSVPFEQRVATLTPVIEQTIDLNAVLSASIGLRWPSLPDDQKQQLLAAFRRYTVSSYVANFDSYTGQTFQISPGVRNVGNGEVVVETRIVATDGSTTRLDYVMRDGPVGWQAVDVLADGSISRVAVQRSDFRHLLASGGVPALLAGLQHKVASLSGSMAA